jgi:nitrogen regulatory protein P-II 1
MKSLNIVIHSGAQQALADTLRTLEQVQGFTFTHVEGHSDHNDADPFLSARDKVAGYVPRVQAAILLADADVSSVLSALLADESFRGQGVYWVNPIDQMGRL